MNATRLARKLLNCCLSFFALMLSLDGALAQVPFSKGVNMTTWFQASGPRQIQFTRFTRKDFEQIKSLGCDAIRLPINLHAMTNGAPDFTLDPLFVSFLDEAVTWAEDLHLYLILDNHTFDTASDTDPGIGGTLTKVWKQMAAHYKDRSEYVLYEVLNEPHGIDKNVWSNIQQTVIDAIRTEDTKHFIVVGAAEFNSYTLLKDLPVYSDTKLIYTFHFYDPFVFTHQGATWVEPSMAPLAGVPFPYNASKMPATPASLKGTWVESGLNNYPTQGTASYVKSLIDLAVSFKTTRNVPVYCGEFGVNIPNSNNADRVVWYETVRKYLEEKNIPWTIWDYTGGFGVFEKNSNDLFDYDLNVPLLEALGMNVPAQKNYLKKPQTTGFIMYDDYIGQGIVDASYPGAGTLDFYSEATPKEGSRCIHWTGVEQYNPIALDFKPDIDLSLLVTHGHALQFWVRGNNAAAKVDLRFIDSKTGADDHPWRMNFTLDNSVAAWDGEWHKVSIPLSDFKDGGSYDNGWFPGEGKFDWKAVDQFDIVAEYGPLTGIDFWFDDLRVVGEDVPYEEPVTAVETDHAVSNLSVYPNPTRDGISINLTLTKSAPVKISISTSGGQSITTLVDAVQSSGAHTYFWDGRAANGDGYAAGLYFVDARVNGKLQVKKVIRK